MDGTLLMQRGADDARRVVRARRWPADEWKSARERRRFVGRIDRGSL